MRAASVVDSTKIGAARVTVVLGIDTVVITPSVDSVVTDGSLRFFATVVGLNRNRGVRWSTRRGFIDSAGFYRAPTIATIDTIAATSTVDCSRVGSAIVTVTDHPLLQWATYFPLDGGFLWDVVADRDDNVIAAGTLYNRSGQNAQATVVSTDSSGLPRWTYTFDGIADTRALVLGGDLKSAIVAGYAGEFPAPTTPLLFVLDSIGHRTLEGTCVDLTNAAFFGATRDANRMYMAAGSSIVTADLAGNLNCTATIDAAVADIPEVRVGTLGALDGNLVVGGDRSMSNQCWAVGGYPFVQKVSGTGQLAWRLDFESTISPWGSIAMPVLAITTEGGHEVTYFAAALSDGCNGAHDYARYGTAKVDADGRLVWLRRWNGDNSPTSCEAYPYAVVPDPRGGVIIAGMGSTDCWTAWDCAVASYSGDGILRWTMKPAFRGNRNNACGGAALSNSGRSLYLVGQTGLVFLGPQQLFVAKYTLPR